MGFYHPITRVFLFSPYSLTDLSHNQMIPQSPSQLAQSPTPMKKKGKVRKDLCLQHKASSKNLSVFS